MAEVPCFAPFAARSLVATVLLLDYSIVLLKYNLN